MTRHLNCIVPPHILDRLAESSDAAVREAARQTLLSTARLRGEREVRAGLLGVSAPTNGRRSVFDCRNSIRLSDAVLVRTEQGHASSPPCQSAKPSSGWSGPRTGISPSIVVRDVGALPASSSRKSRCSTCTLPSRPSLERVR